MLSAYVHEQKARARERNGTHSCPELQQPTTTAVCGHLGQRGFRKHSRNETTHFALPTHSSAVSRRVANRSLELAHVERRHPRFSRESTGEDLPPFVRSLHGQKRGARRTRWLTCIVRVSWPSRTTLTVHLPSERTFVSWSPKRSLLERLTPFERRVRLDGRAEPYVQLHRLGVALEPVCELVLRINAISGVIFERKWTNLGRIHWP